MIQHKQLQNGFNYIEINNVHASAKIALQGAHIWSYTPKDKHDILWVSKASYFELGKAIRGGIPVCFPWFGKHATHASFPQHGFARTSLWKVVKEEEHEEGSTSIHLELRETVESLKLWPYNFTLILEVHIAEELSITMHIKNMDEKAFEVGTALHTYFSISNVEDVSIEGLQNKRYFDALTQTKQIQKDPLKIDKEIDRVYAVSNTVSMSDKYHTIHIRSQGSNSLVLWNPWKEKSASMGDMTEDGYKTMVCLETSNAREDVRVVKPQETHVMGVVYR